MGTFISIIVDQALLTPELIESCVRTCPVDIFKAGQGALQVVPEREDECTLCELCLELVPPGAIRIHKLYSGQVLSAPTNAPTTT